MKGVIFQINIKPYRSHQRGMPKSPVESAFISRSGFAGDYNVYRTEELAGDPDQAVLLYPLEMIRRLNEEGWPIKPGDIGENITSEGLEYDDFSPRSIYKMGEAIIEVTRPCDPCNNLAVLSYVGKEKKKEFIRTMVNRRGWYARVLKEGIARVGDEIKRLNEAERMI